MWIKLSGAISAFGQNIQAVAACAHFFAAGYLVFLVRDYPFCTAILITVYAGLKEFWYDANYEKNPPQTAIDNVEDFAGYVVGAWVTVLIVKL
jgi:hypothetical protein